MSCLAKFTRLKQQDLRRQIRDSAVQLLSAAHQRITQLRECSTADEAYTRVIGGFLLKEKDRSVGGLLAATGGPDLDVTMKSGLIAFPLSGDQITAEVVDITTLYEEPLIELIKSMGAAQPGVGKTTKFMRLKEQEIRRNIRTSAIEFLAAAQNHPSRGMLYGGGGICRGDRWPRLVGQLGQCAFDHLVGALPCNEGRRTYAESRDERLLRAPRAR